jgi:hypothetical protein
MQSKLHHCHAPFEGNTLRLLSMTDHIKEGPMSVAFKQVKVRPKPGK